MSVRLFILCLIGGLVVTPAFGQGSSAYNVVTPFVFDPLQTSLVSSVWLTGAGCPTSDPACLTWDLQDRRVEGLLLVKTGSTPTNASAGAELLNVRGTALEELGFDIRKAGGPTSALGSHCGAGAPRFNVLISGVVYFIGCNSSATPPTSVVVGAAWTRLRWGGSGQPIMAFGPGGPVDISGQIVDRIQLMFDEGPDIGPDFFGAAVLDNVAVNGVMVGRGSGGR